MALIWVKALNYWNPLNFTVEDKLLLSMLDTASTIMQWR